MNNYFTKITPLVVALVLLGDGATQADEKPTAPETNWVSRVSRQTRKSLAAITHPGRDGRRENGGLGTGFVISPDGLIATNFHVVGQGRPLEVQLADGRKLTVTKIHAYDRVMDLAVIQVEAKGLPALDLGDSEKIEQGQPIVAMGNPRGLKYSVVSGVVSGRPQINDRRMIQLAIPIEPGNSGGPVLDADGKVLGVVTMKHAVTENLGFAVEVNSLKRLLRKPNSVPMSRWQTFGALDAARWKTLFGARWRRQGGKITVSSLGDGFGGRSLCLRRVAVPGIPCEIGVWVRLGNESGAAGLVFDSDGKHRHYGFYPSNGRMRLSRFEGPDILHWQVLQEKATKHYRPGEWNHLKVRMEKDRVLCFVNDQLVIESADRRLPGRVRPSRPGGQIGLAKFRDTTAEFRLFRLAERLPPNQLSSQALEEFNRLVDQLPGLDATTPKRLAPLTKLAPRSAEVLRRRAKALERRAAEYRKIANDIHTKHVADRLRKLFASETGDRPPEPKRHSKLIRGAGLIGFLDDEDLDLDETLDRLDRMAASLRDKIPAGAGELEARQLLDRFFFDEYAFHGSRTEYYHRANSHLHRVIDDREGLPITLSVLYIEFARRIGLHMEGVGLPSHFVVRHVAQNGKKQLIDVFEGGANLTRQDADRIVRGALGRPLAQEHLATASTQEILLRMLRNLIGVAQNKRDPESMLRYVEAYLAIDPSSIEQRMGRAILRYQTGRIDGAVADLDWLITRSPPQLDLDRVRQMRDHIIRNRDEPQHGP